MTIFQIHDFLKWNFFHAVLKLENAEFDIILSLYYYQQSNNEFLQKNAEMKRYNNNDGSLGKVVIEMELDACAKKRHNAFVEYQKAIQLVSTARHELAYAENNFNYICHALWEDSL